MNDRRQNFQDPWRFVPKGWSAGPWPRLSPVFLATARSCTNLVSGGPLLTVLCVLLLSWSWTWSAIHEAVLLAKWVYVLAMTLAGLSIIGMTFRPGREPERHQKFHRERSVARGMAGAVVIMAIVLWVLLSPSIPGAFQPLPSLALPLSGLCAIGVIMLLQAVRLMDEMERSILSEAAALTAVVLTSVFMVWTLCKPQFNLPDIDPSWALFTATQVFFAILWVFVVLLRTERWDPADYLGWDARHERQV